MPQPLTVWSAPFAIAATKELSCAGVDQLLSWFVPPASHPMSMTISESQETELPVPALNACCAQCAMGRWVAVFSIEASRLARNGREWHTLLEFCGIVGVLLIDAETVYDPRLTNDRLLLGVEVRSRSAPCRSLEEEFYLPARFVDLGNDKCRKQEVIRQEFQSFVGFNIKIADTS
jgi:hypothetical protein